MAQEEVPASSDLAQILLAQGIRHQEAWYPAGTAPSPTLIAEVQGVPSGYTADIQLLGASSGPPDVLVEDWGLITICNAVNGPGGNEVLAIYDEFELEIDVADNTDDQISEFLNAWALTFKGGRITAGYQLSHFTTPGYAPGPAGSAEIGAAPLKRGKTSFRWPLGYLRVDYKSDSLYLNNVLGAGVTLTSPVNLTIRATKGLIMQYNVALNYKLTGNPESCAPGIEALAKAMGSYKAVRNLVNE